MIWIKVKGTQSVMMIKKLANHCPLSMPFQKAHLSKKHWIKKWLPAAVYIKICDSKDKVFWWLHFSATSR